MVSMKELLPNFFDTGSDDLSRRWIYRFDRKTIVLLITLVSILLSVFFTFLVIINIDGMPIISSLILSAIIPAMVVPIVSWRNIGLSMKLKTLEQKMRHLATWDSLTGLLSRQVFYHAAQSYLKHAAENGEPFSVMMLDLDHFKTINDTYGHQVGDRVLIAFGSILKRHQRDQDIFGRVGGEEFALILPRAHKDDALKLARTIHDDLKQLEITEQGKPVPATVSIGIVFHSGNAVDINAILHKADKALYHAKHNGRNCTIVYPPGETQ